MKALKEKRLSLRSFLRRGLVILSLLALAFASASCSDSSGDEGDSKDTPPPAQTKRVKDITVLEQPANKWFQGMPPDPTGMKVKVEWDDGTPAEEFSYEKWAASGLSIFPAWCDEPGPQATAGQYRVQHISNPSRPSEPINYGGIVWLYSADDITGGDLYADKGLVGGIDGKTTKLRYVYKANDAYQNPSGVIMDPTVIREEKTLTINRVYPQTQFYDYTNMPATKTYQVMIGMEKGGKAGPNTNKVGITVKVGTFYQVVDVRLGDTSGAEKFWAYDDDTSVAVYSTGTDLITTALSNRLKGVKFEVDYQDSNNPRQQPKTESITWDQFLGYVKAARDDYKTIDPAYTANGIDKLLGDTRLANEETGFTAPYDKTILAYDDDSNWIAWLEYVPKEYLDTMAGVYGANAMSGWVGLVEVKLPVAVFANDIKVEKAFDSHGLAWAEFKTAPAQMSDIMLKEINNRWKLSATYTLKNQPFPRDDMGFTTAMFNWGNNGANRGSSVLLNDNGNLSKMATAGYSSGVWLYVDDTDDLSRNFPLPVRYRGQTAGEDDTVRVQLFKRAP